jgi:hypothetical protein
MSDRNLKKVLFSPQIIKRIQTELTSLTGVKLFPEDVEKNLRKIIKEVNIINELKK